MEGPETHMNSLVARPSLVELPPGSPGVPPDLFVAPSKNLKT